MQIMDGSRHVRLGSIVTLSLAWSHGSPASSFRDSLNMLRPWEEVKNEQPSCWGCKLLRPGHGIKEMLCSNLGLPVSTYLVCQHGTLHLKVLVDTGVVLFLAFKLNLKDEKMGVVF